MLPYAEQLWSIKKAQLKGIRDCLGLHLIQLPWAWGGHIGRSIIYHSQVTIVIQNVIFSSGVNQSLGVNQ